MVEQYDGYYWNSIRHWKGELQKRHRQLMARYATMEKTGHPSKSGQGRLISINKMMLERLTDELEKQP